MTREPDARGGGLKGRRTISPGREPGETEAQSIDAVPNGTDELNWGARVSGGLRPRLLIPAAFQAARNDMLPPRGVYPESAKGSG